MLSLIRSFKRHFRRVGDVRRKMYKNGSFTLHLEVDPTSVTVQSKTPDREVTTRFIVLMRRFMNKRDPLYYENLWNLLRQTFGTELQPELVNNIEASIKRLCEGFGEMTIDGSNFTGERTYQLLAEGGYFDEIEEAQQNLKALMSDPLIERLLWHRFFDYHESAFQVVSQLFDAIQLIEKSESYKRITGDPAVVENRCIFCLSTTGDFTTEEHFMPESLGNDEYFLPRGHVCKKCNNGVLATLDAALIESPVFAFLQAQYVPYTKQGKLPKADLGDTTVKRTHPRHVEIRVKPDSKAITDRQKLDNGQTKITLTIEGKEDINSVVLTRAFYKMALGMVAWTKGQEYACSDKFNAARAFILGEMGEPPNNVLISKTSKPDPHIRWTYNPEIREGTFVAIHIFGVNIFLNLVETPRLKSNKLFDHLGLMQLPFKT